MTLGGTAPRPPGTLDHEDDLRWVFFHDARVTADEAKGEYNAAFSPSLSKMEGQSFSITGYMLPIETSTKSAHFVLTRRSAGCPFCPPNEPTEAIEIFATGPVDYRQTPVTVEGRLHLIARSETGLFYRLDRAKVS
ncbi:hypothetical protein SJA_C1-18960 [Sphingobium indicum UT26S]|uniref:DUF3299 domain-containing protein n=2 Tax=Sphingomonadaceae TaxID=41297 RepID=D4Z298_SPHIU|nr:hypothetical protein SJA_C1-18960 [Sphingobium indicum UT26S]